MSVLMKAATNVVLRRDLSLNRRLYAWLLGPDEAPEAQQKYFQQHALRLLCLTLKVGASCYRISLSTLTSNLNRRKKCSHRVQTHLTLVHSKFSFRSLTSGRLDNISLIL